MEILHMNLFLYMGKCLYHKMHKMTMVNNCLFHFCIQYGAFLNTSIEFLIFVINNLGLSACISKTMKCFQLMLSVSKIKFWRL